MSFLPLIQNILGDRMNVAQDIISTERKCMYKVSGVLSCQPVLQILPAFPSASLSNPDSISLVHFFFATPAARTDFRHHISLTPSRLDLGKMERSLRIMSGNVTEEGAVASKKQPQTPRSNLVEDQSQAGEP